MEMSRAERIDWSLGSEKEKNMVPGPRLFNKVGYSRCAPMYGKCRLLR